MPTQTTTGRNMLAREKWQIETLKVLEEVFEERKRQVARYGHNYDKADGTGPGVRWMALTSLNLDLRTAEEIEAAFRAEYELNGGDEGADWMRLVREELAEVFASDPDSEAMDDELIQVAALCVSWVESRRKRRAGK
jgi:hypothetical protein